MDTKDNIQSAKKAFNDVHKRFNTEQDNLLKLLDKNIE